MVFASTAAAGMNDSDAENTAVSRQDTALRDKNYTLRFKGNSHFSEKEMLKAAAVEMRLFEQKGYRKADIDDAAFQMRIHYHQAGFAFADVEYTYEKSESGIFVTFFITEGPRVFITDLNFTGNQKITSETLRKFFPDITRGLESDQKVVFIESRIKDAVGRIQDFYLGEGFMDVMVKSPDFSFSEDRGSVAITIHVIEGPKYSISDVRYSGDILKELTSELEKVRKDLIGKSYFIRRKLLLRTKLAEIYDTAGYAEAEIDIETVKHTEPGSIIMKAHLTSGEKLRISDILIEGNKSTRDSFIRRRLQLGPGDIYTNGKRRESFRKLFDTGLFAKVTIEPAAAKADGSRDLEVIVDELPTREVYIEPGWGSYEKLRLRAGVLEKSLFGTGRNGRLDGLVHTKGETITLSYTDPWLLQTDVAMNVPLFYERREEPSYTSEETGLSLQFSKKLGRNLSLTAGYQYKISQLFNLDDDTLLQQEDDDYNKGTISINAVWDTRDDLFYPADGLRLAGGLDISLPALGGDLQFGRITLGCRYFIELPQEYILGLRASTGLIIPFGDQKSVPISERFFNGGDSTVRSYEHSRLGPKDVENEPIGGHGYNVFSVELRRRFYKNFAATLYVDAGNVSPNSSLLERGLMPYTSRSELVSDTMTDYFKEFKYGIGVGLQYLLPVGPIRFDIAYNPDPEEIWQEDSWVYHFSLGMAF